MTFGERLKYRRKKRKLTQQGLADAAGIKQETICYYERGLREPNLGTVEKIAKALSMHPGDLAFGEKRKITIGDASVYTGLSEEAIIALRKMDEIALEFFDNSIKSFERSA